MSGGQDVREDAASAEYRHLTQRLGQFGRQLKIAAFAEAVARILLGFLILAPALFLLDNWLHLPGPARLGAFVLLAAGCGAAARVGLKTLFQPQSLERLALRIEKRFPQVDNRLINAIQLGSGPPDSPDSALIQGLVRENAAQAQALAWREAIDTRGVKRALLWSLALVAAVSAYPLLLPEYFENAAARILLPVSGTEPLTRTKIEVRPGDAAVGRGESLPVMAIPSGVLPRSARLETRGAKDSGGFAMSFDGQQFRYELTDIQEPFSYRVKAGDFVSVWRNVRVLVKPRVERLAVRIEYPAYTRLKPTTQDPSGGAIAALAGSKAAISAWTNKPIASARIAIEGNPAAEARVEKAQLPEGVAEGQSAGAGVSLVRAEISIQGDGAYRCLVRDAEGLDNEPAPQNAIRALADAPPRASIDSPRGRIEAAQGERVSVLFSASDDYGLGRLTLHEETGDTQKDRFTRAFESPRTSFSDGVTVETAGYPVGSEVRLTLEAFDTNPLVPGRGASEPLTIKIAAPAAARKVESAQDRVAFAAELLALLRSQRAAREALALWPAAVGAPKIDASARAGALAHILLDQSNIRVRAMQLAETPLPDEAAWKTAKKTLASLAANEMRAAVESIKAIDPGAAREIVAPKVDAAGKVQLEIVKRLAALLETLREAVPELADLLKDEEAKTGEPPKEGPKSLTDLQGKLMQFIDDQEGALASLQTMENVDPKDLSKREKLELEDLAKKEDQWAEYFKDAAEWLRKSPMVDGTESGLRDELVEMTIEIEKLPEALRSEAVEIQVDEETVKNGLELAGKLSHSLEKWLPEEPDYQKWVLENSSEEYTVPIATLPDELEDMMGDLLESESDMTQAIEDVTSNWADSLDAGAGWEAADGPISNYSAKGVTGNTLPNNTDISGRSGEGRTGRSLGEMVESVATGKGGRDTQTRMTSDAMGRGVVEDLSTEEVKGATGGGKVAGTTGYGLVAPNAPVQPETVQKLAQGQSDLKMKALDLSKALGSLQLPTGKLNSAIQGMDRMGKTLSSGHYSNLKDMHAVVVSDLKDQRAAVRDQLRLRRDASGQSRQMQHQVRQGEEEEFPEEYRALLSAYYEALSKERW